LNLYQAMNQLVDFAAAHQTTALLIVVHNQVVVERYWGGRKASTVSDVFSVAKSIVSVLVGIAATKGVISLEDRVSSLLGVAHGIRWTAEADPSFEQRITVRHLLTMTSGLDDFMRAKANPGSRWHYNLGTAWHMLKPVLEHTFSSNIDNIAQEQLFSKVGASTACFRHRDTNPMKLLGGSSSESGGGGSISSSAATAILITVMKQFVPALLPSSLLYGGIIGSFVAGVQSCRSHRRWGRVTIAGAGGAVIIFIVQLMLSLLSAYKARKMPNGKPTDTLYMSARDLCAVGRLVLNRGRVAPPLSVLSSPDGQLPELTAEQRSSLRRRSGKQLSLPAEQLVSEEYLDAMLRPSQPHNPAYGYLWWLNGQNGSRSEMLPFAAGDPPLVPGPLNQQAPADMVAALGFGDQKLYVCPSMGLVAVRLGESAAGQEGASATASKFDERFWELLMQAMAPGPAAQVPAPAGDRPGSSPPSSATATATSVAAEVSGGNEGSKLARDGDSAVTAVAPAPESRL
jgi:CubicO group peptidase (beta-lactamase class C family)